MHLYVNARNWTFEVVRCSHKNNTNDITDSHVPTLYSHCPPSYTSSTLSVGSEKKFTSQPNTNQDQLEDDTRSPITHKISRSWSYRKKIGKIMVRLARSENGSAGQDQSHLSFGQGKHLSELSASDVYELAVKNPREPTQPFELPTEHTTSLATTPQAHSQQHPLALTHGEESRHRNQFSPYYYQGHNNRSQYHFSPDISSASLHAHGGNALQISTPSASPPGFTHARSHGNHTSRTFMINSDVQSHASTQVATPSSMSGSNIPSTTVSPVDFSTSDSTAWDNGSGAFPSGTSVRSYPLNPSTYTRQCQCCLPASFPPHHTTYTRHAHCASHCCNPVASIPTPPVASPVSMNYNISSGPLQNYPQSQPFNVSVTIPGNMAQTVPTCAFNSDQPSYCEWGYMSSPNRMQHLHDTNTLNPTSFLSNGYDNLFALTEDTLVTHHGNTIAYPQANEQHPKDSPAISSSSKPKRSKAKRGASGHGSPTTITPLHCKECGTKFHGPYQKGNLQRHSKNFHSEDPRDNDEKKCRTCDKVYHRPDARRKHEWKKHGAPDTRPNKKRAEKKEKRIYMPPMPPMQDDYNHIPI